MSLDALKTEIDTDPVTRGYAGMDDAAVADSLSNVIERSLNKATMTSSEVINAIFEADFDALILADQNRIWNVLGMGELNPFGLEADMLLKSSEGAQ